MTLIKWSGLVSNGHATKFLLSFYFCFLLFLENLICILFLQPFTPLFSNYHSARVRLVYSANILQLNWSSVCLHA